MNPQLKKEIIFHTFKTLGIGTTNMEPKRVIDRLIDNRFLIDQKLIFETEDGKQSRNIWGSVVKLEDNSNVKVMVADLCEEEFSEYVAIIQLDTFPPFALRLSSDAEDGGSLCFQYEGNWIHADILLQAKLLVAIETLTNLLLNWTKMTDYKDAYKILVDFLKFDSAEL